MSEVKVCRTCGIKKPLKEFYRDRRNKDGRRNECSKCTKHRVKDWASANPIKNLCRVLAWQKAHPEAVRHRNRLAARDYRRRNPDKVKARNVVARAIRSGLLTVQPCNRCGLTPKIENGRQRIEAHHHLGYDEAHQLDIVWLCRRCHRQEKRSE